MVDTEISKKSKLIEEIERNLWETWSMFGRSPACEFHEEEDVLWLETPIPVIPYNGVLRFQGQSNVDQRIDSIVEHFSQRKTQFMWLVHPSAKPADLRDRLQWRWNIPDEYKDHYAAITAEFHLGEPGSRAYMWQAWRAGQPIAKAGMYLGSGSAGIYGVVTRPEARGLGLARSLTLTALYEARSSGCRLAVLHSTPMAENLYKSLGFTTIVEFRLFASEEVRI